MSSELSGELLASVSRSFYLSIKVLPRKLREPIGLAYLLARASDTIADSGDSSATVRLEALAAFRGMIASGDLRELPAGISSKNPSEQQLLARLPECVARLQILDSADRADIRDVLDKITRGQELDVQRFAGKSGTQSLEQASDLDEYTYLVAGCVGAFWTRVCFRHVPNYARVGNAEMERLGINFGKGLQLVNILRDLPADLREGRCYLPREEVGDDRKDMHKSFDRWMKTAHEHLADGFVYIQNVRPWRLRYACFLPWRIGDLTLARIHKTPPLETAERVKVSRREVRAAMFGGLIAAKSNWFLQRFRSG